MNIRTKVLTTIIAMACSLSVSATGITAILVDFPIQVERSAMLMVQNVRGDLYGERYGAGSNDIGKAYNAQNPDSYRHLYIDGVGVQQNEIDALGSVNFAKNSTQIEYVFKFVLAQDATSGVMVQLSQAELTNTAIYVDEYKYAYGKDRPDWNTANTITPGTNYIVSESNPYIWLRATLNIKQDSVARIDTSAKWSFSFYFEGFGEA